MHYDTTSVYNKMDPVVGLFTPDAHEMPESLPPEVEEGNVEYKLKLVEPSDYRFEHLVTQMKWRLQEGQGEAVYEIGVEDNGLLHGLTHLEMVASLQTLQRMANRLGADISVLREKHVDIHSDGHQRRVAEVLVRRVPDNQQFIDLRLAVLGNVDAGKSTLLGVLTQGELDNGRGRARLNLFRHLHEIQSGRTSSISHEILGFNSKGEVVNYSESRTVEEICENSTKLITLIDLCGHHKYLKTTVFGLTGYSPDFAMLVVSANTGIVGTTKEHLGFALALRVPIFVVVTKVDQCRPQQVGRCVRQVERLLKSPGCKKIPFRVENDDDAVTAASSFHSESVCPIFTVSSVSGLNLDLLTTFLNVLPPLQSSKERELHIQQHVEHQIDVVYSVPDVGTVVGGTLLRGTVKEGDALLVGPTDDGQFMPLTVNSIHRNRLPCRVIAAGQAASLGIGHFDHCNIRKGMVLVSPSAASACCIEFEAEVYVLFHTHYICKGFQTVVHVGNVCQTAKIIHMDKWSRQPSTPCYKMMNKPQLEAFYGIFTVVSTVFLKKEEGYLQMNEKAKVVFRFNNRPEYIRPGSRLIFREGRTKGMGEVTKALPYESVNR